MTDLMLAPPVCEVRMERAQALRIAEGLMSQLRPHCQRIEIAGSVRRAKRLVGDIELVVTPRMVPQGMFGDLHSALAGFNYASLGKYLKGGEKYVQLELPEGINLDLFIVTPPAEWGVIFTLRTGPDSFSQRCVTPRCKGGYLPSYLKVEKGAVRHAESGDIIPTPEEGDFFKVLGLQWTAPGLRR